MTLDQMTEKLRAANAFIPGKRLKLDFGAVGAVMLDGVGGMVSNNTDGAADTVIAVDWADWEGIVGGTLDPVSAFMQGKLKVQGDMGLAMQVQAMLSSIKG